MNTGETNDQQSLSHQRESVDKTIPLHSSPENLFLSDDRERSWSFQVIVIVGIKIENDIKSFNFVYEISVQYIYFLVLFVKMSEQVTLATVRELLETQE